MKGISWEVLSMDMDNGLLRKCPTLELGNKINLKGLELSLQTSLSLKVMLLPESNMDREEKHLKMGISIQGHL